MRTPPSASLDDIRSTRPQVPKRGRLWERRYGLLGPSVGAPPGGVNSRPAPQPGGENWYQQKPRALRLAGAWWKRPLGLRGAHSPGRPIKAPDRSPKALGLPISQW